VAFLTIDLACNTSGGAVGPGSGSLQDITITPDSASVSVHGTQSFTAAARNAAGDSIGGLSFHWSSGNTAIATIDQNGHAKGVDTGHVQIAASAQGISSFATLAVTPAAVGSIIIVPATDTIAIGAQVQLSDTVKDADGKVLTMPVTWGSSNSNVAFVSSTGQVLGQSAGSATITATAGGKTGSNSTIVVDTTAPARVSLTLDPDSVVAIPNPLDVLVQVTATVTTVTGRVLSNYPVVFTSSDPPVSGFPTAGPDTVPGGSILVAPTANGRAMITATAGSASAQATLTICYQASTPICNPLDSIRVVPPVDTLAAGDSVLMEAVGVDSSGNAYPNMFVEWDPGAIVSSEMSPVVVVEPNGEVLAMNPGTEDVLASIQGFSSKGVVTVTPGPSMSIATGPDASERGARLIAAAAFARRQALDARNRRHEEMRQRLVDTMRRTHNANLLTYYRRLLARIDAQAGSRVQGTSAR
jgi:hypothetical protein